MGFVIIFSYVNMPMQVHPGFFATREDALAAAREMAKNPRLLVAYVVRVETKDGVFVEHEVKK
jgi:hypothetical protein